MLLGFKFGVVGVILAEILSLLMGCIVLFLYTQKKVGGVHFSYQKNILKDFISYGSKIYLGNIATYFFLRIDMWMINLFLKNSIAVGFYSIAVTLAEQIWIISQSAGTILLPRVSSENNEKQLKEFTPIVCRNILFLTVIISFILFLSGRWLIILLYSKKFLQSVASFQILLIGGIAVAGGRILTSDLFGRGKPMVNTYIAIIAMLLNIVLNIILIPRYGINGAAWASTISYVLLFALKLIVYSRISGNRIVDILFIKKSDLKYYRNFLASFKDRVKSRNLVKR